MRVPDFKPIINGLHFTNFWPAGTGPDYTFSVLGQTIKLGDASNGLCGGMVRSKLRCLSFAKGCQYNIGLQFSTFGDAQRDGVRGQ
jgi:hypothetical protein